MPEKETFPRPKQREVGVERESEQDQQQVTKEIWDRQADTELWKELRPPQAHFVELIEQYKDELLPASADKPKALNIGSATGRYLIPLVEYGFDATGIEPSDAMRARSQEFLEERKLTAAILPGISNDLSQFPDGSFNFAVAAGTIHHNRWAGVEKSFSETNRVLQPGGYFFCQLRSSADTEVPREVVADDRGITAFDRAGSRGGRLMHLFTRDELFDLAQTNGFEVVGEPYEYTRDGRYKPNGQEQPYGKIKLWWVVYRKKAETAE